MRWSDLVETSLASLRQRFFRTALTVLGVLIGTTSVVVMVSLGIGMSESMMESISSNATMTRVTVYPGSSGSMAGPKAGGVDSGGDSSREKVMNAETMAELAQLPGVSAVTPVYNVGGMARVGRYEGYLQVTAMPLEALAAEGLVLGQGRLPEPGDGLAMVVGSKVNWNFGGAMDASGNYVTPDIDWMTDQTFVVFDNPNASLGTDSANPVRGKRFIIPVTGVLAGNDASWSMNDMSVFADLDQLLAQLRKAYPGKALPGQPATTDGKPKGNEFHYSQLNITAESVQRAEELTTELRQEGYSVSSNIELMRQIQSQSMIIQAVFGGIGFISLLVAAIGIANTMMMSVYERTKQIGVMKVLGASLGDIRKMFLVESAFIGLFGGAVGLLFSLALSAILNATLGAAAGGGAGVAMKISSIPPWLMVAAVAFATAIGTVAGVAPAQRAMKLSPLAAIRSE